MRFTLKKDKSGVVIVGVEGQLIVGNRQELKQKVLDALEEGSRKFTTPLLSFFRVNRIPLPLPGLENGDRRSVHNIIGGRAARQVRDRVCQCLQYRAERGTAPGPLLQFVDGVARDVAVGDQHMVEKGVR